MPMKDFIALFYQQKVFLGKSFSYLRLEVSRKSSSNFVTMTQVGAVEIFTESASSQGWKKIFETEK